MHRVIVAALIVFCISATAAYADSSGPTLNPYRAYPSSCLAYPLPPPSGPQISANIVVSDVVGFGMPGVSEFVTLIIWRAPCAGGKAALLGTFIRGSQHPHLDAEFPRIGIEGGNASVPIVRVAYEPNTIVSTLYFGDPIFSGDSFVFENYADPGVVPIDFSSALHIAIDPGPGNTNVFLYLPAYDPSQYPTTALPMQISGYQSGNFSDPAGGQGIQIEVAETSVPGQRALVLAWYTYDASGTSYWLFNSTTFTAGARSVSLPLGYFVGGSFAGAAGSASASVWGNVSVSFPDCDHMIFSYQSISGLPAGVPVGSGSRTFTRVTSINGVTCDSP